MRLRRQLNINNTYRVLNLNFFRDANPNTILVIPQNKNKIEKVLKKDNGKHTTFMLLNRESDDLLLNHQVYRSDAHIIYYTEDLIPTTVFLDIGTNRKVVYLYNLTDFNQTQLKNINKASIMGTVGIYAGNINKNIKPSSLLFKLNDVRYVADRLYLDFKDGVSDKDKIYYFDQLHEVLARWTIQLFMDYTSPQEHEYLKKTIIKKYK